LLAENVTLQHWPDVGAASHSTARTLRDLYHASRIVRDRRQHARHVLGRFLEAATGRDLAITLRVPTDLRESPFVAPVLRVREDRLRLRLRSSAAHLYADVNVLRQVCDDYFRVPACVPLPGELVIDAGANVGCYTLIAALLEPTARLHAFEPLSSAYASLATNCRINVLTGRVVANRAALGAKTAELELKRTGEGGQGTLARELVIDGDYRSEITPVVPLDRYVADAGVRTPGIIKVDVEGHEVELAAGAVNTLRHVRLLIVEWHSPERLQKLTRAAGDAGLELVSSCSDDPDATMGIAYFHRPAADAAGEPR
jgi:FkbM family methyltransferase